MGVLDNYFYRAYIIFFINESKELIVKTHSICRSIVVGLKVVVVVVVVTVVQCSSTTYTATTTTVTTNLLLLQLLLLIMILLVVILLPILIPQLNYSIFIITVIYHYRIL